MSNLSRMMRLNILGASTVANDRATANTATRRNSTRLFDHEPLRLILNSKKIHLGHDLDAGDHNVRAERVYGRAGNLPPDADGGLRVAQAF
jgi:hypothetical protein